MQHDRNVTESSFYIAFYNNKVESGCHNLLEHVIDCCVMEMHSFFGIRLLTKDPGGKEKWSIFRKSTLTLGN